MPSWEYDDAEAELYREIARLEAHVILENIVFAAARGWPGSRISLYRRVAAICHLEAFDPFARGVS